MSEGPSMPPLIGRQLGDYMVEAVVGRGGMATVYRARDQRLGRPVALKILAPQLSHDHRFRDRFVRESRLVASIDHPNIIPIYEAGERDDLLFIAMRYVEGSDMRKLVQSAGPLPVARANRLFSQIASALDAAHANGLVHRDVKPANILVTESDHVYLTDFGLTKSSSAEAGLTSHGHFMGTPRYVAPEQIRGLPVDGRSDLYAFACVVYEALAGQPPFQRDTELALLYAHVSHDPPPLTPYRNDLPHSVNVVMARGLAKTPDERFPTCQAFVAALRDAISGVEIDHPAYDQPGYDHPGYDQPGYDHPGYDQRAHERQGPYDRPDPYDRHGQAAGRPGQQPGAQSYPPVSHPPVSHPSVSQPPVSHPSVSQPPVSHPSASYQQEAYQQEAYPQTHPQGSYPQATYPSGAQTAPSAAPTRKFPVGPVIGGLVLLVCLAVAATLIFARGGDTAATWNTYPGSVAAPFTMAYPSTWGQAKTSADQWMIASPATDEFNALFAVPGNTDWSKVNPIIAKQPERAAGVFAQVSNTLSTSDSPIELQQSLQSALPGTVGFSGVPVATTVGAKPAFKIAGLVSDPQQGGRLDFQAYVVRQDTGDTTVLITFFCAPGRCDQQLIEHMVNTVAFTS
ncbi:protein kinase [Planotetraspora sp. A-T 1434]|uniref:serine/threonine-protein kinase n=1 Tax=Planotetraspora sp. A-T 1434 TaxID=2979219 RepID=UPI0021BF6AB7|nr:serine/threonine protein kinase [Planotetraspora sp. A-T 1434]MCT9929994.1 protein kinase [Planotetraspora sp. A-T 1434]